MSTRADRPIVVYGGHVRSDLPEGFTFIDQQGNARTSRDHLAEAMPPLSTWGKTFVAKNFGRSAGDIIRVLASVDGTTIKLNGKPWGGALKGGQYMDYLIELSDTALNNIVSVESNHPILVGMLAHTAIGTDGSGDPFLAVVTPLEQSFNDYTYFISTDDVNFNPLTHYVTVATEKSGVGTISIDGIKQPAQAYTNIPIALKGSDGVTRNCAVATFQQTPGIHRIVSPNKEEQGFTILAYGFGSVISYGYTAGSLLKTLTGIAAIDRPTPGVSPGGPGGDTKVIPPGILVRNISNERIYFDSAIVSYTQNKQHVAVRLKKDISTEIGTIEMCEEKDLELTTSQELTETVAGKIRVYYHSRQWTDLYPVDFPFVITPKPQADVSPLEHRGAMIENYPNPVSLATTVHFRLPLASSASIKIYDALGRMVRNVVSGQQSSGDHYLQVSCVGLSAGDYTIELSAPMIGISEHHHLIVTQ